MPACHKIISACLLGLFVLSCKKDDVPVPGMLLPAMVDSVNLLRSTGCRCGPDTMPPAPPLVWNNLLGLAAEAHATDMYVNNYFSHISPQGTSPIQRAQQLGYTGTYVGENIAKGYATVSAVMQAWKASEDHCKAMMDTLYKEMGAYETNGYWVQEFGR